MHPLLDRRNDGVRHVGEQEGVAVRRGFGGDLDAEAAAGAGTVVDDDLLAERLVHATTWVKQQQQQTRDLRIGYFGSSTGGGAGIAPRKSKKLCLSLEDILLPLQAP